MRRNTTDTAINRLKKPDRSGYRTHPRTSFRSLQIPRAVRGFRILSRCPNTRNSASIFNDRRYSDQVRSCTPVNRNEPRRSTEISCACLAGEQKKSFALDYAMAPQHASLFDLDSFRPISFYPFFSPFFSVRRVPPEMVREIVRFFPGFFTLEEELGRVIRPDFRGK